MLAPNMRGRTYILCSFCGLESAWGTPEDVTSTWNRRDQPADSRFANCHIWENGDKLETISDQCEVLITAEEIKTLVVVQQPANAPITLDELRGMPLKDWVWIHFVGIPELYKRKPDDAYFQKQKTWCDSDYFGCGYPGLQHDFTFAEYKVTWLAYRHPPERSEP